MIKHTVYTVGKCNNPHRQRLTDLTFIVRAASMNILKGPLNHYSGTKKDNGGSFQKKEDPEPQLCYLSVRGPPIHSKEIQ